MSYLKDKELYATFEAKIKLCNHCKKHKQIYSFVYMPSINGRSNVCNDCCGIIEHEQSKINILKRLIEIEIKSKKTELINV